MNPYYPNLFKPGKIGNRVVKNRIVSGPVGDNMCNNDGSYSDQAVAYYAEKAKGGAGIIMPGSLIVAREGMILSNNPRIDEAVYIKGVARVANAVHAYNALIIPQIAHAGARVHTIRDGVLPRCVSDVDPETTSIRKCRAVSPQKELTAEEIRDLVPMFSNAAKRCQIAGCDGVEIHMAHGYLLNEFLSPDTNKRTDEYGGSLENRMRICIEIVEGIRKACGRNFIIGARIPAAEFVRSGITKEEFPLIAQALEKAGCDVLSLSAGMTTDQTKIKEPEGTAEGARLDWVEPIKNAVSIPVMVSGVLKTPEFCDKVIRKELVDFVVLARSLNCDPHWPEKARTGHPELIKPCLSCNGCFDVVDDAHVLGCVLNPTTGIEFINAEQIPAGTQKNVMIIGGGLSGMQAAITCARRGHRVTIYESSEKLGGQMVLAAVPPCKAAIGKACQWFIDELKRLGVVVHFNRNITMDDVREIDPDHVICATGAVPFAPPVKGKELAVQAWDVLGGKVPMPSGKKVAVIGGGLVGCETALSIAEQGNQVTVIEMLPQLAGDMEISNKTQLFRNLNNNAIQQYVSTKVLELTEKEVVCEKDGVRLGIPADVVVFAVGFRSHGSDLYEELLNSTYPVSVINSGLAPANFYQATKGGYYAASVI